MDNCMVIPGDEVREESGRLPRQAPTPSSEEAWKQESNAKPHFHTVFKCLNTSLLVVVGVKYQAISQDPSKTLALNTWSFLIAIFIYSLILFAMKQQRNHCNMNLQSILDRVALASVVVSSLPLMSLLLLNFYGHMVLYISWALFVVISAFPQLQWAYNGLLVRITTVIDFAKKLFNGSDSSQQQSPSLETRQEQPTPQGTIPPV